MQQLPFDKRSGKIWFNKELCEWKDAEFTENTKQISQILRNCLIGIIINALAL